MAIVGFFPPTELFPLLFLFRQSSAVKIVKWLLSVQSILNVSFYALTSHDKHYKKCYDLHAFHVTANRKNSPILAISNYI